MFGMLQVLCNIASNITFLKLKVPAFQAFVLLDV